MRRQGFIGILGLCGALGLCAGCVTAEVEHHTENATGQGASDGKLPKLDLTGLIALVTAIGALGTAAFSLVDATKVAWGGVSRIGLGDLEQAAQPYTVALTGALGPAEPKARKPKWFYVVAAHWMNGRPRDEQKAILKGLIRIGLSAQTAVAIAGPANVDGVQLAEAARKLERGEELSPLDLNVLGRMDASVDAQLDAAFDRADQRYRNSSRVAAGLAAVLLALLAAFALGRSNEWPLALVVGLLAVPFAPIAKDLVSSLQSAASALRATKP